MKSCLHLLAWMAATHAAVAADDAAMRACRTIADVPQRVACYDAIAVPAAASVTSGPSVTSVPAAPGVRTAPQPSAAVQAPLSASRVEAFGKVEKPLPDEIDRIESGIAGPFYGWRANQTITLANGQAWRIADDSSAAMNAIDPKVRVRRGMLGAFYLEIEGTNRSPRVKRVE